MTIPTGLEPTDFTLTAEELAVIRRFVIVIGDSGMRALLSLGMAGQWRDNAMPAKAICDAIDDICETCDYDGGIVASPEKIVDAGPSFMLVTSHLSTGFTGNNNYGLRVPTGCLPSQELVAKCVERFFGIVHERAAQAA